MCTNQMKASELLFPVMLFIMLLYKMVLELLRLDEILQV